MVYITESATGDLESQTHQAESFSPRKEGQRTCRARQCVWTAHYEEEEEDRKAVEGKESRRRCTK